MISNISVSDLIRSSPCGQIIDIRNVEKYNSNHIPNAKNIPMGKLLNNPAKYIDKLQIYYLYCQKGILSVEVCRSLRRLGYKVVNVEGGYESWILEK